jgi:nucleoside-diphosphate-sugar epimerase
MECHKNNVIRRQHASGLTHALRKTIDMKIAITGATGFIGKRLVKHYQDAGAVVHILSRKSLPNPPLNTHVFNFDLTTCRPEDLIPFVTDCDVLYHCAAELNDPHKMVQVNEQGTQTLFQAAQNRIGRWVQLSSVGVYGRPRTGIIDETYPPSPQNAYEKSKLAADIALTKASVAAAMALTIVRPSTVFANDMPNQSLFQMIRKIQQGQFIYIGSRQAQMNYVHADDVLAALILCGHHPQAAGQTYIVSEHITIARFVDTLATQLQCARPWLVLPESVARTLTALFNGKSFFPLTPSRIDAMTNQSIFSDAHLRTQLGFSVPISLEVGLRQLADYCTSIAPRL